MLWLAATPIGNLGDASPRLRTAFESASVVAAEDTRRTGQLIRLLEIEARPELVSLHDHNEHARAAALAERAREEEVLLVSDAGMPTVSDPGFRVVQQAHTRGVRVSAIPGPSAVLTALAVSGLPTDRFTFEGFVPRRSGERSRWFSELAAERRTMVMFDSPARLAATLRAAADELGEQRDAAVCRELTKLHEEVRRGSLASLAQWAADGVRGEVVLVVAGAAPEEPDEATALDAVRRLVADGAGLKAASRAVSATTGLSARDLYGAALAAQGTAQGTE